MPYFDRRLYFLIELAVDASFYRLSAFRFRQKNAKFAETRTKTCYEKNVIAPLASKIELFNSSFSIATINIT